MANFQIQDILGARRTTNGRAVIYAMGVDFQGREVIVQHRLTTSEYEFVRSKLSRALVQPELLQWEKSNAEPTLGNRMHIAESSTNQFDWPFKRRADRKDPLHSLDIAAGEISRESRPE